jgi:ABC-2 type transport system permease protein
VRLRALSLAIAKSYVRDKFTLFFTFAFPLVFLVVFGLLYGHQALDGGTYITFTATGVMAWGVANAALFGVAFTLRHWRSTEVLRVIRMTPTPLGTILGSRFLVAVAVALAQAVFFIAFATLPAFGLHVASGAALALPVLLAGVATFCALGLVVGTFATSAEAIGAIGNCVILPMAFLSGTFYPINLSPRWMQDVSWVLPLRYLVQGTGGQIAGTSGPGAILEPCAALLGFAVLFSAVATRFFRWSSAT